MKTRSQNPIYIATTISVYLGLVLVGASPLVIADSRIGGETQSRIFEFASKTGSVLSKLKLRKQKDSDKFQVHAISGYPAVEKIAPGFYGSSDLTVPAAPEFHFSNEQIFTTSILPRASI
ncbi:MAG: hypothetical protein DWQ47_12245 [Acidobacteria bacterium]|nr:MAG: hypothetical protein DWQ32_14660 [Acidobacteriota bacterium]REJ98339.1 MAG: hypothetical protein DWQ38_17460 [Acidobacteriota bacterium]REK17083.1 MAG: hypothetical protein DWQ43_02505 [Acidobacteriota bacterium]REK42993.1 MAG: hypothetical protein DWQ47_12245 [Acidobacteriota bacterium]